MANSAAQSGNVPDHFSKPVMNRIAQAVETLGFANLAEWAIRLLSGDTQPGADGDPDISLLGGMDAIEPYMARVWAGQALLHAWHQTAVPAVETALADEQWQVREIAVEIVGHHELVGLIDQLATLLADDAYPQVRIAAATALGATATPQHDVAIDRLQRLIMDPNSLLSAAAEDALHQIAQRHDRPDLSVTPRY